WADGRRDRSRHRGGAGTRGAVWQEVGIAVVEPDDGIAHAVGGERLPPSPSPVRIDLDQVQLLSLVGADVERPAGEPARGRPQAAQRERRAERGERLLPERWISSFEEGAPGDEQPLPIVGDAGRMLEELRTIGE